MRGVSLAIRPAKYLIEIILPPKLAGKK